MRVKTHEQGNGTSVAVHSFDRSSHRRQFAAAIYATGTATGTATATHQEPLLAPGGHRQ